MPWVRRRSTRRAPLRRNRRRMMLRRPRRFRPRMTRQKLFNFKRTCELSTVAISTSNVAGALTFKLNDLPSYTELTTLFDAFRIKAVKLQFVPDFSSADPIATTTIGSIHHAIDHNDSSAPSASTDLMQYSTYKRNRLDRGLKRYIKVNTQDSTGQDWNKWFRSSDQYPVPYYGFKYFAEAIGTGTIHLRVYATYYVQCKSTI